MRSFAFLLAVPSACTTFVLASASPDPAVTLKPRDILVKTQADPEVLRRGRVAGHPRQQAGPSPVPTTGILITQYLVSTARRFCGHMIDKLTCPHHRLACLAELP